MSKHCDICFLQTEKDKKAVSLHKYNINGLEKPEGFKKLDVCSTCMVAINGLIERMKKEALEKLPEELRLFFSN